MCDQLLNAFCHDVFDTALYPVPDSMALLDEFPPILIHYSIIWSPLCGSFVSMIQAAGPASLTCEYIIQEFRLPQLSVFGWAKNWIDPLSAFLLGVGVKADECREHGPTRRELDVDALDAEVAALSQPVLDTHLQRIHKRAVEGAEHEPREDEDGVPVPQGA